MQMFQIDNSEYNIKKKITHSLISLLIPPEKPIWEAVKLTILNAKFSKIVNFT